MNLFAVFHGEYEDRDLYGVFTSLGKATAFLVNLNGRVMQGACRGGHFTHGTEPFHVTDQGFGEIREIILDIGSIPTNWVLPAEWRASGPCRVCESAGLPDCNAHPVSV
jgi:hypothetical protein